MHSLQRYPNPHLKEAISRQLPTYDALIQAIYFTWRRVEVCVQSMPVNSDVDGFQATVRAMNNFSRYYKYVNDYEKLVDQLTSLSYMFYWQDNLHIYLKNMIEEGHRFMEHHSSMRVLLTITEDFQKAHTNYWEGEVTLNL